MTTSKRGLVVEDEIAMRKLIVTRLTKLDLKVDEAETWIDAKRFLEKNVYFVVVSDNRMPKTLGGLIQNNMGVELLEWIRRRNLHNQSVPFILHTGDEKTIFEERLAACGGQHSPKGGAPKYYDMVATLISEKS